MSGLALEAPTKGEERTRFEVDVPFVKAAAPDPKSGDLILKGYANTWGVDRDGEFVMPSAFDQSLPDYLAKNPIVLWQHNPDWPIGRVSTAETDTTGLYVEVVVPKPKDWEAAPEWLKAAYQSIAAGVVTTFSIGGYFVREFTEAGPIIVEIDLLEVSVVSIPANADSIFEAAKKSLNGQSGAKLTTKVTEQMAQVLGCEPVTDPELARMGDEELTHREKQLQEVYRRAGVVAPTREEWERLNGSWDGAADLPEEQLIEVAQGLSDFTGKLQGLVPEEKAGRVISKANEDRLRKAYEEIGEVLQQVREEEPTVIEQITGAAAARALAEKQVLPVSSLTFASRDREWDGPAAKTRVHGKAERDEGYDPAVLSKAYLWRDDDADAAQVTGYRFIVADVIDDELRYVPRAIFTAANVLQGGRGGTNISDAGVDALKKAVGRLYAKMRAEFDDPDLKPPWEGD